MAMRLWLTMAVLMFAATLRGTEQRTLGLVWLDAHGFCPTSREFERRRSRFFETVRIGPVTGEDPHLFFGHDGLVRAVAFYPDGKWLASAGQDATVRLWPVPEVTKTPHKRPHDEFFAMLRSWTNLRVVPDAQSATGWKVEIGPFPGWTTQPQW